MSLDSNNTNGVMNPCDRHSHSATRILIDNNMESSHYERAATITGHDIRYTVDVKTKPCCGQVEKKEILKGIE
jgi:hypothetical protein